MANSECFLCAKWPAPIDWPSPQRLASARRSAGTAGAKVSENIGGAWFNAVRRNPILIIAALASLALIALVAGSPARYLYDERYYIQGAWLLARGASFRDFLLAPLAVALHRFVLLGEVRKTPYFFNRTSLKFAGMLLAFQILGFLVLPLQLWGAPRAITLFHSLAYFAIVCWTMLVFPAVAVEEKNAKGRLRTAILRARGNFWKILRCMLLISIVLGLPWFVLLMSYNIFLGKLLQSGVPQFLLSSYYLLMNNAFRLLLAALGAATVSHLYSYAAHRAQEPEVQPVT